jgi:hypothetical protein
MGTNHMTSRISSAYAAKDMLEEVEHDERTFKRARHQVLNPACDNILIHDRLFRAFSEQLSHPIRNSGLDIQQYKLSISKPDEHIPRAISTAMLETFSSPGHLVMSQNTLARIRCRHSSLANT